MAEARSAADETEPKVDYFTSTRENTWESRFEKYKRSSVRNLYRTRNLIMNGLWPTSPWNLCIAIISISFIMMINISFLQPIHDALWRVASSLNICEGLPEFTQVAIVSTTVGVVYFILLIHFRRLLMRVLLKYRRWMYEPPRQLSNTTKVWGLILRMICSRHPTTYSQQMCLPRQPVPALETTIAKFLESVEHLIDEEEFEKLKCQAKAFEAGDGPKMQKLLQLKSWWASNYVTDWWEKYVYLSSREAIPMYSNYYCLDFCNFQPTLNQAARSAMVIHREMLFKMELEREKLQPIWVRNTIPMCMSQYERCLSTTRIPGEECDEIVHYDLSKHVVVFRKGLYYKVDTHNSQGKLISAFAIQKQIEWIIEDADKREDSEEAKAGYYLASLTTMKRNEWFKIRRHWFGSGVNAQSLEILESSIFLLSLETTSWPDMSSRGKYSMSGDGSSIWFDKCFHILVFADGKIGANIEHSWGDGLVTAHMFEYSLMEEHLDPSLYTPEGSCAPPKDRASRTGHEPQPMVWEVDNILSKIILEAKDIHVKKVADIDHVVVYTDDCGKGFMKTVKLSPDGFIQAALQLAYYRDSAGKHALTYESCALRLYREGRTETVRSFSKECKEYVLAMENEKMSKKEKQMYLERSIAKHQEMFRGCMNAEGVDRHLFALFVACKGSNLECDFLKHALTLPWTLSTSQIPQNQILGRVNVNAPGYKDKACPGGGFAPVSDQGYGIAYMIPEDTRIFFHVSSKHSCPTTNSQRYVNHLLQVLADMKALFE
ncbi:carnitine O-palmitoyltransferase 1, liver isoform [Strongylocentrotus purpuratus]|uniref:carnitine O-palmitoyltransferase n=1 Tax=Strongylocentrotus purpuratus TaxID=7668 RepID=A0A7M7MYZ5_STRPU|nr:carnitine O-palmitoyltransferase 1, liver isoform [Strongylocentrotus purpuratus]